MKPYVDKATKFINCESNAIGEILRQFSKLNCLKGKFDFKKGNFNFTITNLTKAAHQLGITEEMLGYVLALIDEYSDGASFSGNSYKLDMRFYGDKKYLK